MKGESAMENLSDKVMVTLAVVFLTMIVIMGFVYFDSYASGVW